MNKKELLESLKEKTGNKSIKLPRRIDFSGEDRTITIFMNNGVANNMQKDCAAFESWAVILRRWLKEFDKIILKWDYTRKEDLHYKRFLYRVSKFKQLFNEWFDVDGNNRQLLDEVVDFSKEKYVLNAPDRVREKTVSPHKKAKKENDLEKQFIGEAKELLSKVAGLDIAKIDRQLPIGVFHRETKAKNKVFPGGKSAVDIWGISEDHKTLNIFELKDSKNMKVGVISEIFFYALIMEEIQKGTLKFGETSKSILKPENEIPITNKIKAYILSPCLHPLIDKEILQMFNRAFHNKGRKVEFGYLKFGEKINYIKKCI